jgi:hypothetical protein
MASLVLLVASGAVASGGGLGSVGSLREIASGPSLPDIGLAGTPGSALQNAEIVGTEVAPPADVSRPPVSARAELASAAPPGAVRAASGSTVTTPQAPARKRSGEPFRLKGPTTTGGTQAPTQTAPPPRTPAPGAPAPVDDIIDGARGLGDTLGEPLRPITDAILKLLRGPPRP